MVNQKLTNSIYSIEKDKGFKTLKEVMPVEFLKDKRYIKTKAYKFKDINILALFDSFTENYLPWPGENKNIHKWVILENGYAVGIYILSDKKYSFLVKKCAIYALF